MVANLEAELLLRVRARQDLSRVELASQLKLAPSTVGAYVDRLIAEGFLVEWQRPERECGRPPTLLALNPGGGSFIGVDFEAQNLLATIVDFSQQPIRQIQKAILPSDSVDQIIAKIEGTIEELVDGEIRDVLGIGGRWRAGEPSIPCANSHCVIPTSAVGKTSPSANCWPSGSRWMSFSRTIFVPWHWPNFGLARLAGD